MEKLLKVFGQIGLYQLGTISHKSLVSQNACARAIYFPPTAKVIRRRSQFIVLSERLDYKSSSLTTRPRRLLSFNVSYSQVSGSGSLSLFLMIPCPKPCRLHELLDDPCNVLHELPYLISYFLLAFITIISLNHLSFGELFFVLHGMFLIYQSYYILALSHADVDLN